ncbi:hypothetical protein RvY_14618-2 [Ramazzottius varieornatus]|uniref:EamA domain-containing protein n=1 Tax=Ramazzottius varieornatus TaxID=947166 RepID=A0A1D1W0C6_RAMVA|nr:hypothetical protein RvY_14618-2 [Ramazzottius varieornatus]
MSSRKNSRIIEGVVVERKEEHRTRKVVLGVVLVCLIACSQVGAAQFARNTYTATFNAPFFVTWFGAICLVICYPVYCLCMLFNWKRKESFLAIWKSSQDVYGPDGISWKKILLQNGFFSLVALGTNYSYVRALGIKASLPSDITAMFASNCVFVFLLSSIVLGTNLISLKMISVALAVSGIVLIAYAEGFAGPSLLVVALTLTAALGAAIFTVFFKKVVGNAKPDQVCLFLSITAVVTAVVFFPVVLILHFTDTESVSSPVPWDYLAGSSAIGVVFNFLLNFGVAYTYPLFIAFGGIVGIPLNHVADWYFRDNVFDAIKIGGTVLIIAGFILIVTLPVNVDNKFHTWVTTRILRRQLVQTSEETVELKRAKSPEPATREV